MSKEPGQISPLTPIRAWPSGRTIHNRLVKVAMYEHLASFLGGPPNARHLNLYAEWAKHNWGIVLTGNVQVSSDHLTLGRDMVVPRSHSKENLQPFRELANVIHGLPPDTPPSYAASVTEEGGDSTDAPPPPKPNRTLALMQLSHPGRQSSNFIGGRVPFKAPLAPSAVRVGTNAANQGLIASLVHKLMFQTPKAMSLEDIHEVISKFARGAEFACRAGFDGVQLHVAHGYLLSQFLSPKSNHRTELEGFPLDGALELIRLIVTFIRDKLPRRFVVSIKLNAADYVPECKDPESLTSSEERGLENLLDIARWGMVDIIEISGGDYEKVEFLTTPVSSPHGARQALFSRFSTQAHRALQNLKEATGKPVPLLLLTGGLRTPGLLCSALENSSADLLGIGRGSVTCPDFPLVLEERLNHDKEKWSDVPFSQEPALPNPSILEFGPVRWVWNCLPKISLIGAGVGMAWYTVAMKSIAEANAEGTLVLEPDYNLPSATAIFKMWFG